MVVRVDAVIGAIISPAPRRAETPMGAPFIRKRKIFSMMTMEESTIRPTPMASPTRVTRFNVRPLTASPAVVIIRAMGMESPMMMVLFTCRRKISRITTANRMPRTAAEPTWDRLSRTSLVLSVSRASSTPAGSSRFNSATLAFTVSETSTLLASEPFRTSREIPGSPLIRTRLSESA